MGSQELPEVLEAMPDVSEAVAERWGAGHLPWRFLDVLISTEWLGTVSTFPFLVNIPSKSKSLSK